MFDWFWKLLGLDVEVNKNDHFVSVKGGIF